MARAIPRPGVAFCVATATLLALAGCTGAHKTWTESDDAWTTRMQSVLGDGSGVGGGSGLLTPDGDHVRAAIYMEDRRPGRYEVLAACRSTATVRLTVRAFTSRPDGDGDSITNGPVLGRGTITCGATAEFPITVAGDADGVAFMASTDDRSGRALWFVTTVAAKTGH